MLEEKTWDPTETVDTSWIDIKHCANCRHRKDGYPRRSYYCDRTRELVHFDHVCPHWEGREKNAPDKS